MIQFYIKLPFLLRFSLKFYPGKMRLDKLVLFITYISSYFCARPIALTNFLLGTIKVRNSDGFRIGPQHVSDGFRVDKEQIQFFKEPKEHF